MNLLEVWFGLVDRQAVKRGVPISVADLNGKLRTYFEGWNKRAHPFTWTKTADRANSRPAPLLPSTAQAR